MFKTNTPIASDMAKIANIRNKILALLLTMSPVMSQMERALRRSDVKRQPISWTAPMKMLPSKIQNRAGNHPHIAAIVGPKQRSQTGDGSKVVSKNNRRVGRNVIFVVSQVMCRGFVAVV